jgi:hypothetical protein
MTPSLWTRVLIALGIEPEWGCEWVTLKWRERG